MSSAARLQREQLERFNRYWEDLYQVVPEARAAAVEAMGEAVKQELDAQIQSADLSEDAKGTVCTWQELRLGSGGGYAAVTPVKASVLGEKKKPKTWKGSPVSAKQVTRWLERGHGARKADTKKEYAWSDRRRNRNWKAQVNNRTGTAYIKGRQFYSFTKLKAFDHAKKAADKVLCKIADEVDY